MNNFIKKYLLFFGISFLSLVLGISSTIFFQKSNTAKDHDMDKDLAMNNQEIIFKKDIAVKKLLAEGRYKCCILKPCSYCFSDPDHQKEELVCDCLKDIMNGEHPCGECIGEILEGEGNPLIAEYFATAISEKLGEQYLDTLKQIIAEKYDIPVSKQL